jgi:hypothetical protein
MLSEVDQCRYIKLILITSRCENRIRFDQVYLKNMLRLHADSGTNVDLTPLFNAGFLHTCKRAYRALSAHPEVEVEKEVERERQRKRGEGKTPPCSGCAARGDRRTSQ